MGFLLILVFKLISAHKPKRIKFGAKKFAYGKIRLVCDGTDGAVVLSITLPTRTGGLVKNR